MPDSKTSRLKKAPSRDDDLMASLEMMESLAADLPLNVSPNGNGGNTTLKRSYTVQHRGNKPPLPKMSSPMLSDSSSTGSNHSFKQVLTPSKFHQQNSGASSPNIYPTSSPKLNRPKELFVRQITLPMDNNKIETPIVPSPSIGSPTKHQTQPPPIPARRFPRAYHQVISTKDSDSGILTSPSPPAIKSKTKTEIDDNLSISSESDSTGSRYDNVIHPRRFSNDTNSSSKTSTLVAAAAEIAAQRASKEISTQTLKIEENFDGDDEDEETSDCSSDILVLDSSSSDTHAGSKDPTKKRFFNEDDDDILHVEQHENHNDEIEISDHFCTSSRNKIESNNFTLPGAVPSSIETTPRSSPASSPNQQTNTKQKHHHFHHHHHHHTGHHHQELEPANIKRLLAAGPTSNV